MYNTKGSEYVIEANAQLKKQDEVYTFQILETSNTYPDNIEPVYLDFTVEVTTNCIIADDDLYAPNANTDWLVYVIGNGNAATTHEIPNWNQGECCYPETLSIVPDVTGVDFDWISVADRTVTITSANEELVSLL